MNTDSKHGTIFDHPWFSDGGPAFPCEADKNVAFKGMSLRDYFAINLALSAELEYLPDKNRCTRAYQMADEMLVARDR